MSRFRVLHYPGDVRGDVEAGQLLGYDELGQPYAVIDTEIDVCECSNPFGDEDCTSCLATGLVTTVHLNHATEDKLKAAIRQRLADVATVPTFASFRAVTA